LKIIFEVGVESLCSCRSDWFGLVEGFPSIVLAGHKLDHKEKLENKYEWNKN
jgi:hypothetical protein